MCPVGGGPARSIAGLLGRPAEDDLLVYRQRETWAKFASEVSETSTSLPLSARELKTCLARWAPHRGPEDGDLFAFPTACFCWCPSRRASCDTLWQMLRETVGGAPDPPPPLPRPSPSPGGPESSGDIVYQKLFTSI